MKILNSTGKVSVILLIILFTFSACQSEPAPTPTPEPAPQETPAPESEPTPAPEPTPEPEPEPALPSKTEDKPAPPPDTTPPPAITGLIAADAYDGRVNLWWDKSTAADFARYNIHMSQSEIADIGGMEPVYEITDIATNTYQVTGLEEGTKYCFAVTVIDKSGNENTSIASVSATPTPMPRGTIDSDISVDIYKADKAWAGTTLLADNHNRGRPRIIEVNMLGEIVWEYLVPQNMERASDVELLPDNHILFTAVNGVYEINRSGEIIWSYLTDKISHDADRLPNGNTIFVWGFPDQIDDAQVKEVNPEGEIVWEWYCRDHFYKPPYRDIYEDGWTHTNAVTRMTNGNTLISLRNFDMVAEVNPEGAVVRIIGEGILLGIHDPEVLPNGNILGSLPAVTNPAHAIEIDPNDDAVVWQFRWPRELMPEYARDANRLPNSNTLIIGLMAIIEVTPEGEIVWQLTQGVALDPSTARGLGFYKAERIGSE